MNLRSSVLLACISLTACSSAPIRSFQVKLWEPEFREGCMYRLENDVIVEKCAQDIDQLDYFMIHKDDYEKERGYQQLLIDSCRSWK